MKKFLLIVMIISLILSSGCWDMIELEDRILPYSVAIDLKLEKDKEQAEDKDFFISFSYPNINALGKNATQEDMAYVINANANSIFEARDEVSSRVHKSIYLKHLNVVVMSEEVFSNERFLRQILDGLKRDFIINKMVNLLITKESAHDIMMKKLGSKRQESVEGLLISLLHNEQMSTSFTPIVLKDFIQYMDHKRAAIIPLAIPEPEISLAGGGIFKDYQFLGYIDKDDNRNITLLNNQAKNKDIDFDFKGATISLFLDEIKSKKKLVRDGEFLKIRYQVEMDGEIHQYIIDEDRRINTQEDMEEIEKALAKIVKDEFTSTIEKLQKDFNADALGILEYLYKFYPKIYKKVEADWDSIFPYLDIEVVVQVNIRRRGLSDF
ncbi:MAG: Ger(x)C family spore germination protein [Tissierellaceae bacterium]|jgi:spore germination protein KC|nr:Ger(x)C family spore germination protein [Tissierellia bacterium]